MKKASLYIAAIAIVGLCLVKSVKAGNQSNWGTSTGANWITPDDTKIQIGQGLVIVSSVPYPAVGTSSTTAMGLASFTLTQVNNSTPTFLGQIAYCSNCVNTTLVVSTGVSTAGSYAGVYMATNTGSTALTAPK